MEIAYRFRIKPGKAGDYVTWVKKMESEMPAAAPGWNYKSTNIVVQGFGDFDAESRWELDDYAALGAGPGSDEFHEANLEFFRDYLDDRFPMEVSLTKTANEIFVPEGF